MKREGGSEKKTSVSRARTRTFPWTLVYGGESERERESFRTNGRIPFGNSSPGSDIYTFFTRLRAPFSEAAAVAADAGPANFAVFRPL